MDTTEITEILENALICARNHHALCENGAGVEQAEVYQEALNMLRNNNFEIKWRK